MFVQRSPVPPPLTLVIPTDFTSCTIQPLKSLDDETIVFSPAVIVFVLTLPHITCSLLVLTYKSGTLKKDFGQIIGKFIFSKRLRWYFPLNSTTLDTIKTKRLSFIKYLIVFI